METSRAVRGVLGIGAGVALAITTIAAWTTPVAGSVYGRVEASQSWLVTFEQGRVGTRFQKGSAALGPETTSMEMFAFDRLGRLSLERVVEPGMAVSAGTTVARVSSDIGPDQVRALQGGVDNLKATRDLLMAGGRKETIERAQKDVGVAMANRQSIRQQLEREEQLMASGSSSAGLVADLRAQDAALSAMVQSAQAKLEEARLQARPEQIAAIDAQIQAAEAEVRVAQVGSGARELQTPIAGNVIRGALPCDPLDPVCLATDPVPSMLQVVVSDPVVVRVPWPGTVPPALGAELDLETPTHESIRTTVADVGPIQRDPMGLPFVPVSVVVPNADGKLTVGSLVVVRPAARWMGVL